MATWWYCVLMFVAVVSSAPSDTMYYDLDEAAIHFESFIAEYNKVYSDESEKQERFEIFKENLMKINNQNEESGSNVHGINKFTDLTLSEFKQRYAGVVPRSAGEGCTLKKPSAIRAPDSVDWRQKGVVTPVKNQAQCGSCWAFSTTGALEGSYAIKHGNLKSFSEQQLVDCDKDSNGCKDGSMPLAMLYYKQNGAMTEDSYKYQALDGQCQYDQSKVEANVTDCYDFNDQNEEHVKEALAQYGPLSIGVRSDSLHTYRGGVLKNCIQGNVDHGVLLVGYGSDQNDDFWIVKNSWDTVFGEEGYVRIQRNVNACSFMTFNIITAAVA